MGGKGQRRREKNFRAAHGGYARLPPPPKANEIDALPSKLRKLMEITSTTTPSTKTTTTTTTKGSPNTSTDMERKGKNRGVADESKTNAKDDLDSNNEKFITPKDTRDEDDLKDKHDKRKAKRKRKQVNDLRFETAAQGLTSIGQGLKRKERKKKYLEAKKNKHKKAKTEDAHDFPGHEKIKFGEVVEAPPKLVVPKALKTVQAASHERLRLQAVEAYRNRKGWVSRPGVHPPCSINPNPSV